jgi:hypothetical protein
VLGIERLCEPAGRGGHGGPPAQGFLCFPVAQFSDYRVCRGPRSMGARGFARKMRAAPGTQPQGPGQRDAAPGGGVE